MRECVLVVVFLCHHIYFGLFLSLVLVVLEAAWFSVSNSSTFLFLTDSRYKLATIFFKNRLLNTFCGNSKHVYSPVRQKDRQRQIIYSWLKYTVNTN